MNRLATAKETGKEAEIKRFESYLKADPENTILWTNLGDLYHQTGRMDEAIACFEKCLMFDEGNMVARSRLAGVLITRHRFVEAEEIIRGILEQTGEDAALLHNLGLCLYYQRRFAVAQESFQRARELGLRHPKNLAYMVYSLYLQDNTEQALELAKDWLEESPGPQNEGYVALLEMEHGDMEAARQRADQVLQEDPANANANIVLGTWHIEQQQVADAVSHFQKVVQTEPDNGDGWQGLGLAYMYQQDFPKAIGALDKAIRAEPDHATHYLIMGWARLADKDAVAAEKSFREAIKADHNFGEAHGGLASALVFQNRLEEARAEIKKAMGLDSQGFGAVFAQSVTLQLQGKGQQGTKLLAKVLEQQPVPRSKPLIEHIQGYLRTKGRHGSISRANREVPSISAKGDNKHSSI